MIRLKVSLPRLGPGCQKGCCRNTGLRQEFSCRIPETEYPETRRHCAPSAGLDARIGHRRRVATARNQGNSATITNGIGTFGTPCLWHRQHRPHALQESGSTQYSDRHQNNYSIRNHHPFLPQILRTTKDPLSFHTRTGICHMHKLRQYISCKTAGAFRLFIHLLPLTPQLRFVVHRSDHGWNVTPNSHLIEQPCEMPLGPESDFLSHDSPSEVDHLNPRNPLRFHRRPHHDFADEAVGFLSNEHPYGMGHIFRLQNAITGLPRKVLG